MIDPRTAPLALWLLVCPSLICPSLAGASSNPPDLSAALDAVRLPPAAHVVARFDHRVGAPAEQGQFGLELTLAASWARTRQTETVEGVGLVVRRVELDDGVEVLEYDPAGRTGVLDRSQLAIRGVARLEAHASPLGWVREARRRLGSGATPRVEREDDRWSFVIDGGPEPLQLLFDEPAGTIAQVRLLKPDGQPGLIFLYSDWTALGDGPAAPRHPSSITTVVRPGSGREVRDTWAVTSVRLIDPLRPPERIVLPPEASVRDQVRGVLTTGDGTPVRPLIASAEGNWWRAHANAAAVAGGLVMLMLAGMLVRMARR